MTINKQPDADTRQVTDEIIKAIKELQPSLPDDIRIQPELYSPKAFIDRAIENVIDDGRRENAFGLLMSLNMLIEFGDAFDYTGADFRTWYEEFGFTRFEILPLAGPASAAIAYK